MAVDTVGYEESIVFFPFSETTGGTTTDTAGARTGVLKGSASLDVAGVVGSGVTMPSTGAFVELAHDPSLVLTDGSISFWARPQAIGTLQGLVSKDASGFGTGGHMSALLRADGLVSFRVQSASTSYEIVSNRSLSAGDWAHVTLTWGAQGMRLYLDGEIVGSNAYVGGLVGNSEPLAIGASLARSASNSSVGVSDFFRGDIDEFAIFGKQIGPAEIAVLMAGEVDTNDAPVLSTPIADQAAVAGAPFAFVVPAAAFADADGDPLSLTATLASGAALPSWLVFDGARFAGTPPAAGAAETLAVRVTASDGQASVSDSFDLTVAPAPQAVDGPIALFGFSETSGLQTVDLVGGHVGVLKGTAALGVQGSVGGGLSLPRHGAFVEVAHDPDFTLSSGTITFSANPLTFSLTQGLISKDGSGYGAGGHMSVLLRTDGHVGFILQTTSRTYEVVSDEALTIGSWADISVSWGSEGMRLFIDDELAGVGSYTGGLLGNAESWAIGASLGRSFRGVMDEVAIYDRQFDPDDTGGPGPLSFAGQNARAKVVDLELDFYSDAARVMPLGDSNTLGNSNLLTVSQYRGYRRDLWSDITKDGMFVDYVGAASNGPVTMPDRDHQGVGGITATTVVGQAEALGAAHRPDVVLMMLGTNDALRELNAANTVPNELLNIMRSLDSANPDVAIFVAPLPPIGARPTALPTSPEIRAAINAQIPGIVEQAKALGIDATFVPMSNLLVSDLYDGVHPTAAGYRKIANAWYDALEERLESGDFDGPRTAITGVQDVTGSELGDYLRGDASANVLDGRGGADRIEGGGGLDLLTGGAGSDTFVFRSASRGADVIADFTRGTDYIEILAAGFGGGLVAGGTAILRSASTPVSSGASGQFHYDRDDGRLSWDADGSGAGGPQLIATLSGAPQLLAGDLLIL